MDLELAGKAAIITGGSGPIGRAVASQMAAEGVQVALASRSREALEAAAAEVLKATGRQVAVVPTDLTDRESVQAMAGAVHAAFGQIDILVNSAAPRNRAMAGVELDESTYERLQADFSVKVLGYLHAAQAVTPYMRQQGWGRIVNVSGLNARNSGSSVGSMRNVSVVALTKNLADELGRDGINVTVVHPALVVSERTAERFRREADALGVTPEEAEDRVRRQAATRRLVTADEVAHVVLFLASPKSVAITGDVVVTGGGAGRAIYY